MYMMRQTFTIFIWPELLLRYETGNVLRCISCSLTLLHKILRTLHSLVGRWILLPYNEYACTIYFSTRPFNRSSQSSTPILQQHSSSLIRHSTTSPLHTLIPSSYNYITSYPHVRAFLTPHHPPSVTLVSLNYFHPISAAFTVQDIRI